MERRTFNEKRTFFDPKIADLNYSEIANVYQQAFGGDPWYEVSKCADASKNKRCSGGYSSLNIGQQCNTCTNSPTETAYEINELAQKFVQLENTRPTQWYIEKNESGEVNLAAIAWKETVPVIFSEKYSDVPEMEEWLSANLGDEPICWLDEVFADKQKKPKGNLNNFGGMVVGLASNLGCDIVAFRTINPRMIRAAQRDLGNITSVFEQRREVPDRRDFVIIKFGRS